MKPNGHDPDSVISLACARFEDALAEGREDATTRAHQATCPACAALARDVRDVTDVIAGLSGPRALPAGFADAVLGKAAVLDGFPADLAHAPPAPPRLRRPRWAGWASAAAVAALAGAVWAGGQRPTVEDGPRAPTVTAVRVADAPTLTNVAPTAPAGPEIARTDDGAPREAVVLRPLPAPAPAEAPRPALAPPIPEPLMDVSGELRAALLRAIAKDEGCRQRSGQVRLTVTIDAAGQLHDRQVLSSAADASAHACVNRALDTLLLPPISQATTLTLHVRW